MTSSFSVTAWEQYNSGMSSDFLCYIVGRRLFRSVRGVCQDHQNPAIFALFVALLVMAT